MTDAIRRMLGLNSWFPVAVSGSQMSLIEDIKNDILDHRLPLASIMRKAKVFAQKTGKHRSQEMGREGTERVSYRLGITGLSQAFHSVFRDFHQARLENGMPSSHTHSSS